MRIHSTRPLFAWDCLDDSPSLVTLREFLASIPDGKLLESLRRARGKGRDDYPVRVLLVDARHEVALAYQITDTKAGDAETLPAVLAQAQQNLPSGRIKTLAYDKAADTHGVHELFSEQGIKPVIQNRKLWKEEPLRMLPGHDGNSNVVYDESGTAFCYDRQSQPMIRHPMAYLGQEPDRQALKYRCPAKHEGWSCPMSSLCNAGKTYGKTVRVPREIDLRRFPELPRATKKFERPIKAAPPWSASTRG